MDVPTRKNLPEYVPRDMIQEVVRSPTFDRQTPDDVRGFRFAYFNLDWFPDRDADENLEAAYILDNDEPIDPLIITVYENGRLDEIIDGEGKLVAIKNSRYNYDLVPVYFAIRGEPEGDRSEEDGSSSENSV